MSFSDAKTHTIPRPVTVLGYSGLIPFITIAIAVWFVPYSYVAQMHQWLLVYAAVILSFMGAVHWGLAISVTAEEPVDTRQLVASVIPALIAWFASFLAPIWNYSILIIAFACLCLFDRYMVKQGKAPQWYYKLRIPLTVLVIVSLITAQLSL